MMNVRHIVQTAMAVLAMMLAFSARAAASADSAIVQPRQLEFGCTPFGQVRFLKFTIHNPDDKPIDVRGFDVRPPFIAPRRAGYTIGPHTTVTDSVGFRPTSAGPAEGPVSFEGVLTIDFSSHDDQSIALHGKGSPMPRLDALYGRRHAPVDSLAIGTVAPADSLDACITIGNPSCIPLTIERLIDPPGGVFEIVSAPATPFTVSSEESATICVRFRPAAQGVNYVDSVGIALRDGPPQRLIVTGSGATPDYEFHAIPGQVDFGEVLLGKSVDSLVRVVNTGDVSVDVDSIAVISGSADDFSVSGPALPARISSFATDTLRLRVRFTPTDVGQRQAWIRLYQHGIPLRVQIALRGIGRPEPVRVIPLGVNMDTVLIGDSASRTSIIVLRNLSPSPIGYQPPQLMGAQSSAFALIDARNGETPPRGGTIPAGDSLRFSVRFAPTAEQTYDADAVFSFAGGQVARVVLRGVGASPSRDEIDLPTELAFPCSPIGDTVRKEFRITNNSARAITIDQIFLRNTADAYAFVPLGTTTPLTIAAHTSYTGTMGFAPQGLRAFGNVVEFKFHSAGSVRMGVVGQGVAVPKAAISREVVEFASVPVDSVRLDTFSIANTSACAPLIVTSISARDTAFTLSTARPSPDTIPGGGQLLVTARFKADQRSLYDDTAFVQTSRGDIENIALRASGDRAPHLRANPPYVAFPGTITGLWSNEVEVVVDNNGNDDARLFAQLNVAGADSNQFAVRLVDTLPVLRANGAGVRIMARFGPTTTGPKDAVLIVSYEHNGRNFQLRIPMSGQADAVPLLASPAALDMGTIQVGDTADSAFTIHNTGGADLVLDSIGLTGADSSLFLVSGPNNGTIRAHDSVRYSLRFMPNVDRVHAARFTLHAQGALFVHVDLSGTGAARGAHRLYLTDASAQVGDTFMLALRASPPLRTNESVTMVRTTLAFNRTSLAVLDILPRASAVDSVAKIQPGNIVVQRTDPGFLTGDTLMLIRMIGMSTATPVEPVAVSNAAFTGTATLSATGNGTVYLSGCDIGHTYAYGRPVHLKQISPMPTGDAAHIRYRAPAGTMPRLQVLDAAGIAVLRETLPEATGDDQEYVMNVQTLYSGFYFIELEVGGVRSAVPVIVRK